MKKQRPKNNQDHKVGNCPTKSQDLQSNYNN